MPLTNTACKNAKPEAKPRKMADGNGLYLEVMPNGSKYWRMKYRIHGKEKRLAIGVYPEVTLEEAREARAAARKQLADGLDPSEEKKRTKLQQRIGYENNFKAVALEWVENKQGGWSKGHVEKILNRLEKDIFPFLGNTPIANIEPPDLLNVLRKIENRGALDIAGRTRQICGQVFRYAIQTGRCQRDPSTDLKGALKTRKTTHLAAIDIKEVPELLAAVERNDARLYPRTRRAIKLSLLTFVRPGELRQACWEEIDFAEKQWVIPGERMKMGRDHICPLSDQAIEILREQHKETGHINTDYVFPGQQHPQKPMSDGTVRVALQKLGFKGRMTAHGFRALARTAIREKLNYDPDVIEVQLAHKAAGPLGEAYNRAQFIDRRTEMMQEWADYLDNMVG